MKKKTSATSQHGKLIRTSAEDILNRPLTRSQKAELARLKDRLIDYSDIPPLTAEQLSVAKPPPKKPLI